MLSFVNYDLNKFLFTGIYGWFESRFSKFIFYPFIKEEFKYELSCLFFAGINSDIIKGNDKIIALKGRYYLTLSLANL
jgi:hypothetical protein